MAKKKLKKKKEEVKEEEEDVVELTLNFNKSHVYLLVALVVGFGLGYVTHLFTTPTLTGAAVSTGGNIQTPQGGEVNLRILNDPTCEVCDPSVIITSLQKDLGLNLNVQTIDYDSSEGKALIDSFELNGVPAYIFDETITTSEAYSQLSQYLTAKGNDYLLAVSPAKFTEPIPDWTGTKPTVMLFVMSQCPYGVQAEKAAKPLVDAFGDEIDFQVHFIATDNGDGTFKSLHDQPEVDGDLRQVCIQKYYSDKYWDYLLCVEPNYKGLGDVWEGCAVQNGIDVEIIKSCAEGSEGQQLLSESIAASNQFGASSSPTTFVVDSEGMLYRTDVRNGAQVQSILCGIDSTLTGCDAILEGTTAQAQGAQAQGGC
ncbi:MAG: hypothetical protein GOU97_03885 [Nanoarchaeota archaeon]|nr:hypothetical protein [Nanoarchaeota archaeon]